MDISLSKLQEMVKDREACHAAVHGVGHKELNMTERLNNNNKNNFIVLDVFAYGATRVVRDLVNFDGSRVLRYLIQSILDNLLLSFITTRSLKTRKHMVKVQKICPQITLVQLR